VERETASKKQVIDHLKSIEGRVRGIERMMEEDAYCIDLIKQGRAVQGALDKVDRIMLENHLKTCVTTAIRGEQAADRERVIGELLDVFEMASTLLTASVGRGRALR
jgi:DNA-binding FrmR family transcriptional regulator